MKEQFDKTESTLTLAQQIWGSISGPNEAALKQLVDRYSFSIATGDLMLLEGRWYVTNSGLLGLSRRKRCIGIQIRPVPAFCDSVLGRWTFRATVYKSQKCRGFVGYGDADPSN